MHSWAEKPERDGALGKSKGGTGRLAALRAKKSEGKEESRPEGVPIHTVAKTVFGGGGGKYHYRNKGGKCFEIDSRFPPLPSKKALGVGEEKGAFGEGSHSWLARRFWGELGSPIKFFIRSSFGEGGGANPVKT